jgi:release factor glutamine methyltransferase
VPTIHQIVAAARLRLYDAGIPPAEADLDARLLIEHLLDWDAARYFAHGDAPASDDLVRRFAACVDRRVQREPVAYIIGTREFWGLPFEVSPAVLIPRPETELIVQAALDLWPSREEVLRIADVCTGSGCLAVALALERPRSTVVATDISPEALDIAKRNLTRHGVAHRVGLAHADLLTGVEDTFDLMVANPPYVPDGDRQQLQPEVVHFEPHVALFAAGDGLSVIRPLLAQAVDRLRPGGILIFEFGYDQGNSVDGLVAATPGLALEEIMCDLQGIPRTAVVRRVR